MADEAPFRVEARKGSSVSYRERNLLSLVDPVSQAERVVAAAPVFPRTIYVCVSPLFGYGLASLLERMTPDSAILCIEAEERLFEFSLREFSADLAGDRRLKLASPGSGGEACSLVRREYGARRFRRVVFLRMSGGYAFHAALYARIEEALRTDVALDWANAMTLVRLGRRYALNAARNLHQLSAATELDSLSFGDAPVLVVGAGPSLDKAAPLLKERRCYRLVCVDTALPPLLERGVRPDLVVVLEAQQWNLRDFLGAAESGLAMAADLSSLPRSLGVMGGEVRLFAVPWTRLRFMERLAEAGLLPPELPPLGSVGLAAVSLALRLGKGPVAVAGLDFSYRLGAYHARSAPTRLEGFMRTDRFNSLIDPAPAFRHGTHAAASKNGDSLRTDPALRGYRDLFEREFSGSSRLFDVGDDGLDLGIPRLSLKDAERLLENGFGDPGRDERIGSAPPRFETGAKARRLAAFIDTELMALDRIKAVLSGKENGDLDVLIRGCDYLWAHFPEYAAKEDAKPACGDLVFLKRVRAELDAFIKAFSYARERLPA